MLNQAMGMAEQIRDMATASKDWRHNQKAGEAYAMFDLLNERVFDGTLPQPVIGFDDTGRLKRISKYHYEGDNISLQHHIDLRLGISKEQMMVGLLMAGELMKLEVYDKKDNWYFSEAYKKAMKKHGLVCGDNGNVEKINPGFGKFLAKIANIEDATPAQLKQNVLEFQVGYEASMEEQWEDEDYGELHLEDTHLVQFMAKDKASKPKTPKKTQKFACQCNGDPNGSTTFWAVRIAPGTICGACKSEFLPTGVAVTPRQIEITG